MPKKKSNRRGGRKKAGKRQKQSPTASGSSTTSDEEFEVVEDDVLDGCGDDVLDGCGDDATEEFVSVTTTAGSDGVVAVAIEAGSSDQETSMDCSADRETNADGSASTASEEHPDQPKEETTSNSNQPEEETTSNLNQTSFRDVVVGVVNDGSSPTEERPKVNMNEKKDHLKEGQQQSKGSTGKPKTVLTTTVFLAAPVDQSPAFVGEDVGWRKPTGSFQLVKKIDSEFGIFRGIIPVPSRDFTAFKFVLLQPNGNFEYEGDHEHHNRYDKLLPDSIYFFTIKPNKKSTTGRIVERAKKALGFGKTDAQQEILAGFLDLAFDFALEKASSDWDAALDTLSECLRKLRFLQSYENFRGVLLKFADDRLQLPEFQGNFDHLFLLVVGAHLTDSTFPKTLQEFLVLHAEPFIRYLSKFRNLKRNQELQFQVCETLAIQGGSDYYWIPFRMKREYITLKNIPPKDVLESLVKTMTSLPSLLLKIESVAGRVIRFLLKCGPLDDIYDRLLPVFEKHPRYKTTVDRLFLMGLLDQEKSVIVLTGVLHSRFLKEFSQQEGSILDEDGFKAFFSSLFDRNFSDIISLACSTPDYLLPFVTPIVENLVSKKLEKLSYIYRDDYRCFSNMESTLLIKFPHIKKIIDEAFLRISSKHINSGNFDSIPSIELILQGLAERLATLPFLERPNIVDLRKSVAKLPQKYFQNLHIAVKGKDLKAHRKGETADVVEAIEKHFELVDVVVVQVKSRRISLKDVAHLQDPQLADYLKHVGLEDRVRNEIRQQVEELRKLHELYSVLYKKFARLNLVPKSSSPESVESDEEEEEVSDKAAEPIQVLDPEVWENYLKNINGQSDLQIQDASSLQPPAFLGEAVWLNKVKDCPLFLDMIWYSSVQKATSTPLVRGDLSSLVQDCAVQWLTLAQGVAEGSLPFQEMGKVVQLQPDAKLLAQAHFQFNRSLEVVNESYRDFTILQKLQHSIGPFVASLRLFKITRREEIDALYSFIDEHLIQNWAESTLAQVRKSGIIEMIKGDLQIDPEKPETMSPLELIGSLITNKSDGSSPLVEWLRKKKPQDMEAMGKILQGSLLEAYGQLQTLRTRIAPFLDREFETYQHLLNVVRETEQRFSLRIGNRVQPIKCPWLAKMLPDIDAAVRASVISPAEDAKEKLAKLSFVVIDVQDEDDYIIEIQLEPTGSLSMDELKQAFQLLDMSITDDNEESIKMRKSVGLILRLAEVFAALFNCGSITYSLQSKKTIKIENLDQEIQEMQRKLLTWKELWKEVDEMPLLVLFSRSYLLHLADLIRKKEIKLLCSILLMLLPSATEKLERSIRQLVLHVQERIQIDGDEDGSVFTEHLIYILRELNEVIQLVYYEKGRELNLPNFLVSFGRSLRSHFIDKSIEILNVSKDLVAGSALAAYISFTGRRVEPSRILFVTASTSEEEVKRFMTLWSMPDHSTDEIFIIVHIERLSASAAGVVRDAVGMVLPEKQTKLLLLTQQHHRVQNTKSLAARLGLVSDRLLDINFTAVQLSDCLSKLLPETSKIIFFTSKLPGCGKSQQVMRLAAELVPRPDYYRVPIRLGTVEELLGGLKKVENLSRKKDTFIHLDVAHSTSLELNDLLLSLFIHGALYNPNKAKLGCWSVSNRTTIAIEFASPSGAEEFPVIGYIGQHSICECTETTFSYELAAMPKVIGQKVVVSLYPDEALVAAAKFLKIKQTGVEGLAQWDAICAQPDTITANPLPKEEAFRYLVGSFHLTDNRQAPTFSALNAMASFIHRHISAMTNSIWFNGSAIFLFGDNQLSSAQLAQLFKTDVFHVLLRVANDSVTRSWSILNNGQKEPAMDWIHRQRALFLLGLNEDGQIMGMNIVGRDKAALKAMFNPALLPFLEAQCLEFQELKGFNDLLQSPGGGQLIVNVMRSLLLLDGTASSVAKVLQLDSHPRNTPTSELLRELIGTDHGYVLTGDNITKMMFALYRIRCGLPVIAFGEAGVGKSALFRFLIQSLLGHEFRVCNVNSGTTIQDVAAMVEEALEKLANERKAQVFLLFDEMNTADPAVIAFFKELMLDRHFNGAVLHQNLHILAAANPYRSLIESDKEAAVGLAFRFAPSKNDSSSSTLNNRNLVYRVNELPLSFYDHIYDFGHLCDEAESTYIEEICQQSLPNSNPGMVQDFIALIRKSHRTARRRDMSPDPDSAVSLRDTTRAAQLFQWFCDTPAGINLAGNSRIAVELSIYLVYAFRFKDRTRFLEKVFGKNQSASRSMMEASRKIANTLYEEVHGASIGSGAIALNEALCENLFALYVCVLNGIFLIIVGRPGSSKSLSVEILKLVLSPGNHTLRQKLGDLPALTERYFQCSPMSTTSGFKAHFESAQRLSLDPKTMLAMVVLDELGLADLSPEKPIKVLHSELERRAVLTSGEQQQSPYSVVALSNWVVDAAQVNRGILISRTQANAEDLLRSSIDLAETLVSKHASDTSYCTERFLKTLDKYLVCISNTYQVLDSDTQIGGGHFFSMRDFFFCVKNFVCSILQTTQQGQMGAGNINISNHHLIQSIIRNFGGHDQAQQVVRKCVADCLKVDIASITTSSPLNFIVQNIKDSSNKLSVHIARHLMILNRSLIGLQLLNHFVKDDGLGWNVIFGSCFPGDLQVMAVTRKLRQVEQAIRSGGVLILCHAEQLFESLYMVLNQQYWAQDDVMMTQIALGPSIRPIVLPDGPFRIIALQDIDTALNPNLMSPAVLSRFEKHELKPSHLLDDIGEIRLYQIESHPVWMAVPELIKRKRLLFGYHEESFATLALHLQDAADPIEGDESDGTNLHVQWMRAVNPMAMIKLEREARSNEELLEICRQYRKDWILEGIDDAMDKMSSSRRIVIMTNTLRHLEVSLRHAQSLVIRLFYIQTELDLQSTLDSVNEEDRNNPDFCIFIQYDATTGPIDQFQLTKYEIDTRMEGAKCRIVFIVHVDPRPVHMRWVFSFGDGWDYVFVDELVPIYRSCAAGHLRLPLKELINSPIDRYMADFIEPMMEEAFRSLLLEMLGPNLQTSLSHLRSSLGPFYSGVRGALDLSDYQRLTRILKECLVAQLTYNRVTWNVVDVVSDPNFDSSSSLTEGLWGAYKNKISVPLAHLLLTSDVWKVTNMRTMSLWCDFVDTKYPDRLMLLNSNEPFVPIPVGFRFCSQPFGRLLASFDAANQDPNVNGALRWLFEYIAQSKDAVNLKKAYFKDWVLLHVPPHLHACLELLPLEEMVTVVNALFENQQTFFREWKQYEPEVIAALELVSITMYASTKEFPWNDDFRNIRSWKLFSKLAARVSIAVLAEPAVINNQKKWIQSMSSIEISTALGDLLDRVEDVSQLWLGLRITKRMLLFDPNCQVKLPELLGSSVERLIQNLTELVLESIIRPRLTVDGENRLAIRQVDLYVLLNIATVCSSSEELCKNLRTCPITNFLVPFVPYRAAQRDEICPCCDHRLFTLSAVAEEVAGSEIHHLVEPDVAAVESLFQDNLKFLFFFERVAELFVHHQKNHPDNVHKFLSHLLVEHAHLQVSWRFLTVVMKSVLSTRSGCATIDSLLANINCNASSRDLNSNTQSFLRALLARADEEVRSYGPDRTTLTDEDWNQSIMTKEWTVERIRQLAVIREALDSGRSQVAADALNKWTRLRRIEHDPATTEAFLFFVLNFSSGRGDETRLRALFGHHQANQELDRHPIIRPYMFKLVSPLSLGFDLLPTGMRTQRFEERLSNRLPLDDILPYYHLLQELEPDWAPYIARLALHTADVADSKGISFLRELVTNPSLAAQSYLPGMDNHPHLASFLTEGFRWYICVCGIPNFVGNCGQPTNQSICINCRVALAGQIHGPRPGVRHATLADFQAPRGLAMSRIPSHAPSFTVRNKAPIVTRFCLLLNYLALMTAAMDPQTSNQLIAQLMGSLAVGQRQQQEDRRSFIRFLTSQTIVHLDLLCRLLIANRRLTRPDQFRIGHFLLHKLLDFQNVALMANAQQFTANPQTRDAYENGFGLFLAQQRNLELELDRLREQSDEASRAFQRSLTDSQTNHWAYACLASSNRTSVQLILARDEHLRQRYPFLNLLLDENWSNKLNALQHLGNAMRFIALVRTVLQGTITLNEANRMTIDQGLSKMIEMVEQKAVLLDRGRAVSTMNQVYQLYKSFKSLWDRFSQIPNLEHKTFLDYFECQEVNLNIRPRTLLDENAPLILILAGTDLPETIFACQLLSHAVETASSIAQLTFVQPGCRANPAAFNYPSRMLQSSPISTTLYSPTSQLRRWMNSSATMLSTRTPSDWQNPSPWLLYWDRPEAPSPKTCHWSLSEVFTSRITKNPKPFLHP